MIGSKLIARALPDRILAYLDYQLGQHRKFDPWGGPMNGQMRVWRRAGRS